MHINLVVFLNKIFCILIIHNLKKKNTPLLQKKKNILNNMFYLVLSNFFLG